MKPLEGLLVLDFSQFLAGPYAALRLADLGADAVKIENPNGGDICRHMYISNLDIDGDSSLFQAINRNKSSIALDLKAPEARGTLEALIKKEMVPLVMPLIGSDEFWIDVMGFVDAAHRDEVLGMLGCRVGERRGHLKVKGVKILLDGSPQGGTAWMAEPYLDGHNGSATVDLDDLRRYLEDAAEDGLEVAVHCNGDAACRALVDAAEDVSGRTGLEQHVVMIHSQFLTPDLMDRMKAIGMEPSFFVSHAWYWGDLYVELFGRERADRLSPCGTALSKGMRITLHQDEPVLEPWPMDAVFCAVNRLTEGGDVRGEDERIGIMDALRAVTVDSAGQNREPGIGTIREGGRADLVILDRNPLRCDPKSLRDVTVVETMKGGRTVYRR